MTYVLPVTQARRDFLSLVDKVNEEYTRVDLTKNGRIKATLISSDYIDSLEETIYTLQHSMDDIAQAKKEIRQGKYVTLEKFSKTIHASKTPHSAKKSSKKRS